MIKKNKNNKNKNIVDEVGFWKTFWEVKCLDVTIFRLNDLMTENLHRQPKHREPTGLDETRLKITMWNKTLRLEANS